MITMENCNNGVIRNQVDASENICLPFLFFGVVKYISVESHTLLFDFRVNPAILHIQLLY